MTASTQTPLPSTDKGVKYPRNEAVSEFFFFSKATDVFSLDAKGGVVSRRLALGEEPQIVPSDIAGQFVLPFGVEGSKKLIKLPLGINIITGATGAGKSELARALTTAMPLERVLAVEPHDTGAELSSIKYFSSSDSALAYTVRKAYADPMSMVLIDSLRSALFETDGAAGAKGIIMPFFTQITRVSSALARSGITVLATINPMDEDADYVAAFMSKLAASVPSLIQVSGVQRFGKDLTFSGTYQDRPLRKQQQFVWSTTTRDRAESAQSQVTEIVFTPADVFSDDANFINTRAIARAIKEST